MSSQTEMGATIIEGVLDKLVAEYAPEKVVLFGSYAYGNPGPDSDIDLLIIKQTSERFFDRCFAVRRVLSDPKRKVPLEVLVLTPQEVSKRLDIGDQFIAQILEKGRVLYAAVKSRFTPMTGWKSLRETFGGWGAFSKSKTPRPQASISSRRWKSFSRHSSCPGDGNFDVFTIWKSS